MKKAFYYVLILFIFTSLHAEKVISDISFDTNKANLRCDISDYIGPYELIECNGNGQYNPRSNFLEWKNIEKVWLSGDGDNFNLYYKVEDRPFTYEFLNKYSERKVKNGGCVYQVVHKNHYWGLRKELSRLILDPNNKDVIETYETYIPWRGIIYDLETFKYRCKLKKIY